jgi:hypothetical protein
MHAGYQGSTHTAPKADILVWRVADKAQELSLQVKMADRQGVQNVKPTPDLRARGREKFALSSLATFNKKITNIILGKPGLTEAEPDELPPLAFAERNVDDDDDFIQGR